jgi:hypothetical protein
LRLKLESIGHVWFTLHATIQPPSNRPKRGSEKERLRADSGAVWQTTPKPRMKSITNEELEKLYELTGAFAQSFN